MRFLGVPCLLCLLWAAAGLAEDEPRPTNAPVVQIEQGKLVGTTMVSRKGKQFYAYLGIPYARPPVGKLRFQVPRKPDPWEGVLQATQEGNRCPQLSYPERKYEGDEDCLYVNVYAPLVNKNDGADTWRVKRDVIVVIHGGGFQFGSGDITNFCPDHMMDHELVLVTFNYRLGPLGFLSTGDTVLPGNYGLKDQAMLLRWLRRNIGFFGGNPKSITLLGIHAGGASAHYHMFTELSYGKFQGAISISGTALSPWAQVSSVEARRRAFRLGELVGCRKKQLKDSELLLDCLLKTSAEELVRQIPKILDWSTDLTMPFVPVTEPYMPRNRTFVTLPVEQMIRMIGQYGYQVPWLIGSTSHEGLGQSLMMLVFRYMMNELNEDPGKYVPKYLGLTIEGDEERAAAIGRQIWDYYMEDQPLTRATIGRLINMTSDFYTYYGVTRSVELHTNQTSMPMFVYNYAWQRHKSPIVLGVPQGADVHLLFPNIVAGKKLNYTREEYKFVDKMVEIIVNFAKGGDPTKDKSEALESVVWPRAEGRHFTYQLIDKKWRSVDGGLHPERMAFWESILAPLREEESERASRERALQEHEWEESHRHEAAADEPIRDEL
ncbi:venom carboxylesterase-6-like [Schistocerca gregaria]|uniref:venom carboxylesterase-6-like n=1 Tax=Schistocerca gregaria TaxID=7010 RepID=UPI00211E6137|nr:venom carboxylesterase-6-like [Schistocerca gregaria]